MNIFAVSPDPAECAQALDSRRLVKMCLETAQIICTATGAGPYKSTHANHPVVRWATHGPHTAWTYKLHVALCGEYASRFGKIHSSFGALTENYIVFQRMFPEYFEAAPAAFQNCARNKSEGLDFTSVFDTNEAYKLYLLARWSREFARAAEPPREYFDGECIRKRPKYPAPTWHGRGAPAWAKGVVP